MVTGEDLARLLPRSRADAIRRDLVAWDSDLFESVRDASRSETCHGLPSDGPVSVFCPTKSFLDSTLNRFPA